MFMELLICIVIASNHTKCVLLSNQKCMTQPTIINLYPDEYSQEFLYYSFVDKLDRCAGSCITLNDWSNKVFVPNKTEDINLSMFNMITGINESKTLTKHISCECKCKFDERKCNSDQWWNNDKCKCECKKRHVCEKIMLGILLHVVVKMENIKPVLWMIHQLCVIVWWGYWVIRWRCQS